MHTHLYFHFSSSNRSKLNNGKEFFNSEKKIKKKEKNHLCLYFFQKFYSLFHIKFYYLKIFLLKCIKKSWSKVCAHFNYLIKKNEKTEISNVLHLQRLHYILTNVKALIRLSFDRNRLERNREVWSIPL